MKTLLLFVAFGVITSLAQAQKASEALQKMIATERAFAQMSLDKGTKMAFLSYFAPIGVTFQNNEPTNGQAHWQKQPEDKGKLLWIPVYGNISTSCDLGYDTGPWAYYTNKTDTKAYANGSFITIWRKQNDGSWKVVLDLGVGHPELASSNFIASAELGGKPANQDTAMVKAALMSIDYLFSRTIEKERAVEVYTPYLSENTRLYRYGIQPLIQKNEILKLLEKPSQQTKFEPINGDVSQAGDLGYVYGKASSGDKAGNYLRVWRRSAKHQWKLLLEVVTLPVE